MKTLLTIIILFTTLTSVLAQTQTVKGTIRDMDSQETLIGASIVLKDSDPVIGTVSDVNGEFVIGQVPIGRQVFIVQYL